MINMKKLLSIFLMIFIGLLFSSVALSSPSNIDLINAVTLGNVTQVESALKEGNNPNEQNQYGWTPLLAAAAGGQLEIATMLLDAGANPNIASHTGETPLLYAVMTKSIQMIDLLIDRGADPNKKTTMGLSPASMAKTYGINIVKKSTNQTLIPQGNTTLVILTTDTLEKAKTEAPSVGKFNNNSIEQFAYYLGQKDYGLVYRYAPIGIAVVTPYSLSKYGFYKEKNIYRDFPAEDQKILLDNNDTIFIMTYAVGAYIVGPPAPIQNVIIKKNGIVYKPINANTILQSKWNLSGTWWAFPIGLFNAKEEMEIIIIDGHDNVKPLKVLPEKLERIQ